MAWRCTACGNKTRFDVFVTRRVRSFQHFTLGGDLSGEEEEVLESRVESVVCRWCGAGDAAEELPPAERPAGDPLET
jgi:hypothetical protein